jgi:hypothetical protein
VRVWTDSGLVSVIVGMLGSVLVVVVLVVGMVSLQEVSLRRRGGMVHGLPFVVFVLLQLERVGSHVVVFFVVALVGEMLLIMLTPLWSKCLATSFTLLVLTPVLSRLFTHVLDFEFQVGDLRNV